MNPISDYYQVGGTIHRGAQSYIVRQADEELFAALSQGEFCYVLDSRQIGKSSLMLRTAWRLREQGVLAIILDLTALGQNLTAEQWYAGLLGQVSRELWQMDIDLEDQLDQFWLAHPQMGPFQRWMNALRDVVLAKTQQPIVIFVDEIDAVRSLPFSTDEFFAGIREGYNRRTRDPEFKRLTFCLLGVATPSDLMQEARMTPFNIGKRIELKDFTPEEAAPLAAGLGRDDRLAKKLLDRILYWTGGHPYLTQVLCRAVAEDPAIRNPTGVDRQCEKLFLSPRAREKDDNLLFVSRRILSAEADRAGLLHLYETIRARKRTRDDETNPLAAHLRLSGLTRVLEGYLWVRNRIYFRVFDREWVNANMPDAEVRRQKAAFQRGLVRASLVAAVIIVSLLGGIVWYWDAYLREHVTHYKNMVKRYGIPEGVGKLSTAQASHRAASLEFVTKGRYGPLLRVRAVDGSGALTPQHRVGTYLRYADEDTAAERECQWEFVLDRDKRVVYEIARDRFNRLVWGFVYSPTEDVSPDAKKPGKRRTEAKAHFVGPDGYPQPQRRSGAEYVKITYDEDGNETKVMYTDRWGNPMPGLDKAYGRAQKHNRLGLASEIVSLDQNGLPMVDEEGNAILRLEYDEESGNLRGTKFFDVNGNITRVNDGYAEAKMWDYDDNGNAGTEAYFGPDGKPALQKDGYHKFTSRYNERGNRIEGRFFGLDNQPILSKAGYHVWKASYDARGNQIEWACFDTEEGPVVSRDSGLHRITKVRNDLGRLVEETYFGVDGKPAVQKNGYHKFTALYNEHDNRIEERYFGLDNQPILSKGGYHVWKARYDARGNRVEDRYFGLDDQPILSKGGYHLGKTSYDARGNALESAFFDTEERPVADRDSGVHRIGRVRDDLGRIVEEAYFGPDTKPTLHKKGYHKFTAQYDERGNRIEERYFGLYDRPLLSKSGFHVSKASYDVRGNHIVWACFDTEERPMLSRDSGFHRISRVRDDFGRLVEEAYFGADGKPALDKNGCHKFTAVYDDRDNRIEERYFGLDNQPILSKTGFHLWKARYDARGNKIEERYFGLDNQPVLIKAGYHKFTARYDARGNRIEWAYFDTEERPVADRDSGFHRVSIVCDELGRILEEAYFDPDDKPALKKNVYHKLTAVYDERGNRIEQRYFGLDSQPIPATAGFYLWKASYDARNNILEERCFGPDNQPIPSKAGYHLLKARYDARDNQIEWAYFDIEDGPAVDRDSGLHRVSKVYDELGRIVEETYFDPDGNPMLHKNGYYKLTARYDERGNKIEERYFGLDNQPILSKAGYHLWKSSYDARGNPLEWTCFDTEERPVVSRDSGFHRISRVRDELGRLVEEAYFDADGKATLYKDGYHKFTARYDKRDNQVESAYFDTEERPVVDHNSGVHRISRVCDELGRIVEEAYFGVDGKPALDKNGYYKSISRYDARGEVVEKTFFDLKGWRRVVDRTGIHGTDDSGRVVLEAYYDDWKPILTEAGYHKYTARYDARGNQIEWAYFDTKGGPVIDRDSGVHRINKVYDESRRVVQEVYFGPDGKPTHLLTARYDEGGNRIEERYLDVDGSPLVSLIQVLEVFPNTEAMRVGLQPGDFVWSYGDWVFRAGDEIPDFGKASEAFVAATRGPGAGLRKLVVIRGPSLIEFRVNPGRLGIGFGEFAMPDTWLRKVVSAGPVVLSEPTPVEATQ